MGIIRGGSGTRGAVRLGVSLAIAGAGNAALVMVLGDSRGCECWADMAVFAGVPMLLVPLVVGLVNRPMRDWTRVLGAAACAVPYWVALAMWALKLPPGNEDRTFLFVGSLFASVPATGFAYIIISLASGDRVFTDEDSTQ